MTIYLFKATNYFDIDYNVRSMIVDPLEISLEVSRGRHAKHHCNSHFDNLKWHSLHDQTSNLLLGDFSVCNKHRVALGCPDGYLIGQHPLILCNMKERGYSTHKVRYIRQPWKYDLIRPE